MCVWHKPVNGSRLCSFTTHKSTRWASSQLEISWTLVLSCGRYSEPAAFNGVNGFFFQEFAQPQTNSAVIQARTVEGVSGLLYWQMECPPASLSLLGPHSCTNPLRTWGPGGLARTRGEARQHAVPPSNHFLSFLLILSPGFLKPGLRVHVNVAREQRGIYRCWMLDPSFPLHSKTSHTFSLRKEHLCIYSVWPQWSLTLHLGGQKAFTELFVLVFFLLISKVFHWFNLFLNQPGKFKMKM